MKFVTPARNFDNINGPIPLTCDEQLAPAKRHIHRLVANLYGNLVLERRINQTNRIAFQARNSNHTVVWAVAGNLRGLRHVFESHCGIYFFIRSVYKKKSWFDVIDCNNSPSVGGYCYARQCPRRGNFSQQLSRRQIDN